MDHVGLDFCRYAGMPLLKLSRGFLCWSPLRIEGCYALASWTHWGAAESKSHIATIKATPRHLA